VAARNPWLVVIDMQTIFSIDGKWWGVPNFDAIIGPIQQLAAKYGADQTLLTRFVAGPATGSWGPYYQDFPFANVPPTDPIYDLVAPIAGLTGAENVVTATTFSKWDVLQPKTGDYPTLILTGVATDCCVLSTAIAAAEAGAFVTVVMDACGGSSAANQAAAQAIFAGYAPLITIASSAELLSS
jgi:nicotinamidase-related amidase